MIPLQGASRVVGGFAHGRALGNFFNHADQDVVMNDLGPVMGKVMLYFSNDDPGQFDLAIKPSGTVKCPVSPTVGPVLATVGRKFSPVRGK
jgi:hypothetical protein